MRSTSSQLRLRRCGNQENRCRMLSLEHRRRVKQRIDLMEANIGFPLNDVRRIQARDLKLQYREDMLSDRWHAKDRRNGCRLRTIKCKCCICMGSSWSKRSRTMARKHLENVGRHSFCRGRTEESETTNGHYKENTLAASKHQMNIGVSKSRLPSR
ncbi:hypothetical protein KC19_VG028800 [Ceratodon purpureus]|uniref:Uncharacterized protein n=1 Tax=Ceratodon purpureus TaxID=3225 RepID=A0A8T0HLE4_CERPU|nr:hypothetical protein KC19_VG028800 [Ceratodon purpureus]